MNLEDEVQNVNTMASFMAFVGVLRNDFVDNKNEWTNRSIDRYLDGIAGWIAEYGMSDPDKTGNTWQLFANILWAASEYEVE